MTPHQFWGHQVAVKKEGVVRLTLGGQAWLCDQSPRTGVPFTHNCLGTRNSFLVTTAYKTKSGWHQASPFLSPSQALEAETGRLAMSSWHCRSAETSPAKA